MSCTTVSHPRGPDLHALLAAIVMALASGWASSARAQQYYEPPPEDFYTDDRVRFTAEGQLGGMVGSLAGLGGGASISIGLQMNDIFAAYASHRIFFAAVLDPEDGGFVSSFNAFVLEMTLFDRFQLGAGPSLDVGIGSLCRANELQCDGLSDVRIGMEARLAMVLGERTAARRRGVSLALTVHPTWIDESTTVTTVAVSVGYALF